MLSHVKVKAVPVCLCGASYILNLSEISSLTTEETDSNTHFIAD
jgi:hypothetical protein